MGTHLDQQMVDEAVGDLDAAQHLEPAAVAALRLADVLTSEDPIVAPAFHESLSEHFSQAQILELGAALAVASGWQRFIEAFGIRPDHWNESTPPPRRPA